MLQFPHQLAAAFETILVEFRWHPPISNCAIVLRLQIATWASKVACHVFWLCSIVLKDVYAMRSLFLRHILSAYLLQAWGVWLVAIVFRCQFSWLYGHAKSTSSVGMGSLGNVMSIITFMQAAKNPDTEI